MKWQPIVKTRRDLPVLPNMVDYEVKRTSFSWRDACGHVADLSNTRGINMGYEAVGRHAAGERAEHVAMRWISKSGTAREFTYRDLDRESNRFANLLRGMGIAAGDRVAVLAGRVPELYIAALGALKHRSVFCPLFSAFGPEPIRSRLAIGQARVLVTTSSLFESKVAGIRSLLPDLEHVLIVRDRDQTATIPGTIDMKSVIERESDRFDIERTDPEDLALLHFTSGTTGTPKGAMHVHQAIVVHQMTGQFALDLHPSDIFWCTADPGWVTGTSYGILAPLTNGVTMIVDEGEFEAERWYRILQEHRVSVWYTAPTAIRMMMKLGTEVVREYRYPSLRFMASVGEPLNPEAVMWGNDAFGLPFHDNWWQTETGGIMIANYPCMDIRPGSMGKPLPGIDVAIVRKSVDGGVEVIHEADQQGELAIKAGWPSMFRGYWNDEARYRKCFSGEYYLTGDLVRRDRDGYFWFIGRKDDVIKTSGHLIGPFEVESTLLEHPAVADSGVIGKPDPSAMEIVKAFVSLKDGFAPTDALRRELLAFARKRLGAAVAPKELEFLDALPKTRSGKIMRRLLKAREMGLPEGDTSTLEVN